MHHHQTYATYPTHYPSTKFSLNNQHSSPVNLPKQSPRHPLLSNSFPLSVSTFPCNLVHPTSKPHCQRQAALSDPRQHSQCVTNTTPHSQRQIIKNGTNLLGRKNPSHMAGASMHNSSAPAPRRALSLSLVPGCYGAHLAIDPGPPPPPSTPSAPRNDPAPPGEQNRGERACT